LLLGLLSAAVLAVGVHVGAHPQSERVKVRIKLVDAANGKSVASIVHVLDADKKTVELPPRDRSVAALSP
jgi:hypothetical protein